MSDCIFCKIISKEIPCTSIYEDEDILAFLDTMPTNKGHTLVVPREHHKDLLSTPDNILHKLTSAVKKLAPAILKATGAQGFNTIANTKAAAGQVIFHTHIHIIPRFSDDGLKHWPGKQLPQEDMKEIQKVIISKL